jgi:hypothetical protein
MRVHCTHTTVLTHCTRTLYLYTVLTQGVEVSESVRYLGDHTTAASAATASAATTGIVH